MTFDIIEWDGGPITAPGLYDLPADAYYGGGVLPENLGQSEAKVLLDEGGPAKFAAARAAARTEKKVWDFGTTVHALVLGKGIERIEILDFDNFTTKAAKEARDLAYFDGKTPMLRKDYDAAYEMADAVSEQVGHLFTDGHPEVSMLWQHPSGLWLRGQADYLTTAIDDFKTTNDASRRAVNLDIAKLRYYLQGAWYRRLVKEITGEQVPFRIVFAEKKPPYLTRVVELSDEYLTLGEAHMDRVIDAYLTHMETGRWPGYTTDVETLHAPHWLIADDIDEQAADTITALEAFIGDNA